MFDEGKYYGEIWLPENDNIKYFCVLEFLEGNVYLETNLSNRSPEYKKELIYGVFNSLGYLTFVNNSVKQSTVGIISFKKYSPEYVFVSSHHKIDPYNLKIKEFKIDNSAFNEWIRSFHWFDNDNNKIEKEEDVRHKVFIKEKLLEIEIIKTTKHVSNLNSFNLINVGYVSFNSQNELSVMETIEIYKTFQKFLLLFYGKSNHFKSFRIKCLSCGEWFSLYFNDDLVNEIHSNFIKFNYIEIKNDLNRILQEWYLNEDVQFCSDIILENILTTKVSHSRRFTNSLASFEAFNKRFGANHKNPTVEKYFNDLKNIFIEIMMIEEEYFKGFVKKIIRTRDYYVHGNKKQMDIFSKFELLYISFLIDFVIGVELSKQLGFSNENIKDIINKATSVYVFMQSTNRILDKSIL
jgi:hypothetical protein